MIQDGQTSRPARPQRVRSRGVLSGTSQALSDARTKPAGCFTVLLSKE